MIARSFTKPEVEEFLSVVTDQESYEFDLQIHRVTQTDPYVGKTIRHALFREQGYIVIGLRFADGRMKFAPEASQVIEPGQEIFLLGTGESGGRGAQTSKAMSGGSVDDRQ